MGRRRSPPQGVVVTLAFVSAWPVAAPSPSRAAQAGHVDGPPCNDLCKAYMAWSDQVMAKLHPSQPRTRAAVHHEKPTAHHASATRPVRTIPSVERSLRSNAALQSIDAPPPQASSEEPASSSIERSFASDRIPSATAASAEGARGEAPEAAPVPLISPVSVTQENSGMARAAPLELNGRFVISLALALCCLLSLLAWGWFRYRAATIR